MAKNKVLLVIILTIIVLVVAGYLAWRLSSEKTPEEALEKTLKSAATGGVLPEMSGTTNPLEEANLPDVNPKVPETNPFDRTNPFKNLKTNPFE